MGRLIPLRILCLALLMIVGTATAAPVAPTIGDARLEVFMLAGGSPADLCHHDEPSLPHAEHCSLCHLIAECDLPSADLRLVAVEQRLTATVILPQVQRAALRPRDPVTPLRGPPANRA